MKIFLKQFGMNSKFYDYLISNSKFFKIAILKFLSFFASFILMSALIRLTNLSVYGEYSFMLSIATVLCLPFSGIHQTIIESLVKIKNFKIGSHFSSLFMYDYFCVFYFLIVLVILYLFLIINKYDLNNLIATTLLILPNGFIFIRSAIIKTLNKSDFIELNEGLIKPSIFLILVLLLNTLIEINTIILIFAYFFSSLIIVLNYMFSKFKLHGFIKKRINLMFEFFKTSNKVKHKKIFKYSIFFGSNIILINIPYLYFGYYDYFVELSEFRILEKFVQIVSIPLFVANMLIVPVVHKINNLNTLEKKLKKITKISFLCTCFLIFTILMLWHYIYIILTGDNPSDYFKNSLYIMLFSAFVNVSFGSVGYLLLIKGFSNHLLLVNFVIIMFYMIMLPILVTSFSLLGMSLLVGLGIIFTNISNHIASRYYLKISCTI